MEMEQPIPATARPPRAARKTARAPRSPFALAALAAAAVLLGACGGVPRVVDLPAWDPEPGSESDAFLFPQSDMVIESVDGRAVAIGHRYWVQSRSGSTFLNAEGPAPSPRLDDWNYYIFSQFTHDSALLSPGPHKITVLSVIYRNDGENLFGLYDVSAPVELAFTAEPRTAYRVIRKVVPGDGGERFWPLVVENTCPLKAGDWIWPTKWDCYKTGPIAASLEPAHVGRRYDEVFGAE